MVIFDRPEAVQSQRFVAFMVNDADIATEAFPDRLRPSEWTIVTRGKRTLLRFYDGVYYTRTRLSWRGPLSATGLILVWSEKDVVVASFVFGGRRSVLGGSVFWVENLMLEALGSPRER